MWLRVGRVCGIYVSVLMCTWGVCVCVHKWLCVCDHAGSRACTCVICFVQCGAESSPADGAGLAEAGSPGLADRLHL
jgi:hypothetical protein